MVLSSRHSSRACSGTRQRCGSLAKRGLGDAIAVATADSGAGAPVEAGGGARGEAARACLRPSDTCAALESRWQLPD
jgi:hypothetical protein